MRSTGIGEVPGPIADLPAISEADIANFQTQAFTGRGHFPSCHYFIGRGQALVPVSPELKEWAAATMITAMAVPLAFGRVKVAAGIDAVTLTPIIWFYLQASLFWDFMLAAGGAMVGVLRVGLPCLTLGDPADMLREGLQLLRTIPQRRDLRPSDKSFNISLATVPTRFGRRRNFRSMVAAAFGSAASKELPYSSIKSGM